MKEKELKKEFQKFTTGFDKKLFSELEVLINDIDVFVKFCWFADKFNRDSREFISISKYHVFGMKNSIIYRNNFDAAQSIIIGEKL